MNKRERDIIRHALGWPKSYRNYFCTGEGSDDYPVCESLVEAGMMERGGGGWWPDNIYVVTAKGREQSNKEVEG